MDTNDHSRLDKVEVRIDQLEKQFYESQVNQVKNYAELEKVIAKAVKEGNQLIIDEMNKIQEIHNSKFKEQEDRISKLETKDDKKASATLKLIITTAITTTAGWIILGFLNNYISFVGK